jgi:uncharacterized LabA/DUF88 family protein
MSEMFIWEPVSSPAGESDGSNGGSSRGDSDGGGSRGGRSGSRSSSIIARRRPAAKKDGTDEVSTDDAAEKQSRTPRRRRARPAAEASAEVTTETDAVSEEASEEPKTPRRRRSRAATAESVPTEPVAEETPTEEAQAAESEVAEEPAPRKRIRRAPAATSAAVSDDMSGLRALVEQQSQTLSELRAGMLVLGEQLDQSAQRARLAVFVDVPNVMYGLEPDEKPLNMGKLLNFIRQGRDLVRATAYSPVSDDPSEPLEQQKFVAPFVPYDYRIVTKPLKRFADGSIKGNFDVEMAIDMVTMADRLDVISIVSGDADFARAVEVAQTRGVRVEVVAFAGSASLEMRSLADRYIELGAVIDQVR